MRPGEHLRPDMPDERNTQRVGQPIGRVTVEHHISLEFFLQHCPKAVAKVAYSAHGCQVARNLASLAEPNGKHCALRSGAAAALVASAMDERFDRSSDLDEKRPHALRRADLVTGDRQEIDAEIVDLGRNLPDGLRGIGMKEDATVVSDARARRDRLNGPDLVVGVHDADENGARRDRLAQIVGGDLSGVVDREIGHSRAEARKKTARRHDRRMFDRRRDDVITLVAEGEKNAFEPEIVGLASTARENDFVAVGSQEGGHLRAGILQSGFGWSRGPVSARWIAVMLIEVRPPGGTAPRYGG